MFSPTKIHVREPKRSGHHDNSNRTYLLSSDYTFAWENWHGETNAECNDINTQGWTSAAINVVLDFVMLGLPCPSSRAKLKLRKRKKGLPMRFLTMVPGLLSRGIFPFLNV
jgi:hypothetical protein